MKIFHHVDNDGNLSAAIIKRKYSYAICIPYNYTGQFPWHLIDKNEEIFIVDLSFKNKSQFNEILQRTKNITWIDHHISSKEIANSSIKGIRVDSKPAACVLCWEHLFQDAPMPEFISIINDYDTWAHQFGEKTSFFNTAMASYNIDSWLKLLYNLPKNFIEEKIKEGKIISQYLDSCYKRLSKIIFNTKLHGHSTSVCNAFGLNASAFKYWEEKKEIKSIFYFDGTFYNVSLYSETVNCAHIAEQYGGGGHAGAAGYKTLDFPFKTEDQMGVYRIVFIPDGKVYIGSTSDSFRKRFIKHKRRLRKSIHENQYLQNYWNKYGEESFKFDIIELCKNEKETLEREKFWLDIFFKKGKNFCFNLSNHIMGGNTLKTPEIKLKHHINLKKSYTPELLEKRRLVGLKRADDLKKQLQKTVKTNLWKNHHKKAMQELAKRPEWRQEIIKRAEKMKRKVKTDRNEIFDSITQAAQVTGAMRANIRACINGKIKTCMGRKWFYV